MRRRLMINHVTSVSRCGGLTAHFIKVRTKLPVIIPFDFLFGFSGEIRQLMESVANQPFRIHTK